MLQNSNNTQPEIDLDLQLEETQKLKRCILEFSNRLQQAQERLLEENVSKKIKEEMISTQKPGHQRRYNSCTISKDRKSRAVSILRLEDIENHLRENSEPKERRKSDCFTMTSHTRKLSQGVEDPIEKFESFNLPLEPSQALRHFKYVLTSFEQGEILEYTEIFFLGLGSDKVKSYTTSLNYGFDDERGDYRIVIGDHIAYRYQVLEVLGKGSFGHVVKVIDHKTKENLALKIIRNKARFHEQAQIEIKVLQSVLHNDSENKYHVVHMKNSLKFRNHSCIVFELLGHSLYQTLKSHNFKGVQLRYIRRYAFQMFQSLYLLSKLKLIHCDLKPENILLDPINKSSIKIIDFGSSCSISSRVFNYIQSRFYRAPEVIFGIEYTSAIDIWSVGCILVELFTGLPLFPGENEVDLFNCMIEVLGVPDEDFLAKSQKKSMFFNSKNEPRIAVNSKGRKRMPDERPLDKILSGACEGFVDLVKGKN